VIFNYYDPRPNDLAFIKGSLKIAQGMSFTLRYSIRGHSDRKLASVRNFDRSIATGFSANNSKFASI